MQGILPMQQLKGVPSEETSWEKPRGSHKAHCHLRLRTQPLPPTHQIPFLFLLRRRCRNQRLTRRLRRYIPVGGADGFRQPSGSPSPSQPPPSRRRVRVVRRRGLRRRPGKPDLRGVGGRGTDDGGGGWGGVTIRRSRRVAGVFGGFPAEEYSERESNSVWWRHRITGVDLFSFVSSFA